MKLEWTRAALRDFNHAQNYIAQENPLAAQLVAQRLAKAVELLLGQPNMGRLGQRANTREWVVADTPYIIIYRVKPDSITNNSTGSLQVLRIWHGRQNWK